MKIKDKIILDELCICGHSKKSHGITNLDNHGGECNQCRCQLYTWGKFVFYEELKKGEENV